METFKRKFGSFGQLANYYMAEPILSILHGMNKYDDEGKNLSSTVA